MLKLENSASAKASVQATRAGFEWQRVDCPLCGGEHWANFIEARDPLDDAGATLFNVVRCNQCELCFTNPRPTPETIGTFYPHQYRPHHKVGKAKRVSRWRRWSPLRLGKDQERTAISWHGQGRLLDFGCGSGSFLQRMGRQGWQVTGMDSSALAVERLRAELGIDGVVGSLPHPELAGRRFDVITMWHSLEHVHQPLEVLRAAHELLEPGGQLIVGVPNIASLPFRWFRGDWFGLDLPRHLTHFTPVTLQRMLERAGFRAGPMRMIRHSDWLRSTAHLAARRGNRSRRQRCLEARPICSLVAWYSYLTRQTDCIRVTATR
jgi:SAM-dependent methyltransferase